MQAENPMDDTPDGSSDFDPAILAGVMDGYLRYAVAQQARFLAAGETPPVTEDSDHNRFLWCRIRYPAFFRHVAREMDMPLYHDRVTAMATAAATAALKDNPTLQDWTRAMGEKRRDENVARYQRRLATDYAPDTIHIQDSDNLEDERMRTVTTSFDPIPGQEPSDRGDLQKLDPDEWKRAPIGKFRSMVRSTARLPTPAVEQLTPVVKQPGETVRARWMVRYGQAVVAVACGQV